MFNEDKAVLGTTMMLKGQARTVIEIMPPRFQLYGADLYIPLDWNRPEPSMTQAMNDNEPLFFFATAILKRNVSLQRAATDIQVIARQIVALHPRDFPEHFPMDTKPMNDVIVADFNQTLTLLIAAATLLLLISPRTLASPLLPPS